MFQLGRRRLGGVLKWLLKTQASGETMTEAIITNRAVNKCKRIHDLKEIKSVIAFTESSKCDKNSA